MVAGVWSNSNYDDENNTREKLLQNIDRFYETALRNIYGEREEDEYITEMDDNPFFAAMKRPQLEIDGDSAGEIVGRQSHH